MCKWNEKWHSAGSQSGKKENSPSLRGSETPKNPTVDSRTVSCNPLAPGSPSVPAQPGPSTCKAARVELSFLNRSNVFIILASSFASFTGSLPFLL